VRNVCLILFAFVLVLGIGCGNKQARVTVAPGGAQVKVQTEGGTATITGGQGDLSSLPEPLRYPGATPVGNAQVQTPEGIGNSYVMETTDPKDNVVQFYKSAMPNWGNKMTTETPQGTMLMAANPDGSEGMTVGVTTEGDKTQVTVVYWRKQ
jgi:hypothetical protein